MMKLDYDEISPITGKKTVLVESINENLQAKICMSSGYNTFTNYNKDNPEMEKIEAAFPDIIRDSKIEDDFGFYWYLSSMNLGVAILYPEPDEEEKYLWCVMPVKMTEPMKFEMDTENAMYFGPTLFEEAFDKLQTLVYEHTNNKV